MFVTKSNLAINLITDRLVYATLLPGIRWIRPVGLLTFVFFSVHCLSTGLPGQVTLKPPVETLPSPDLQERAPQQDPGEDPNNVLMSGPMHEAFLEVHEADPKPNAIVTKRPPESINEVPPEYKPDGDNVQWIPGYWGWDFEKDDFVWISGLWRDVPPDRRWIPGYWQETEEGFRWVSGYWQEEEDESIDYLPEPPASIDSGPSTPAPGEDYFYVPGNWVMRDTVYRWSPGYWQTNVANWVWVPSRYIWCPHGYIYRAGYWDRVIDRRGIVFAPVYYSTPYYRSVSYRYTPRYTINVGVQLLPHLFVNLRHGHFYYGDWYGSSYRRAGLCPWVDAPRHYRRYYDPLVVYYSSPGRRYNNRNCYSWARDHHHNVLVHNGPRPYRTFASVRGSGLSGSVNVSNGFVSIGVRYNDFVDVSRRSGRGSRVGNATNAQHVHHDFRRLTATEIQRETTLSKPIHDVRVARQSHESRAKGKGNEVGKGRNSKSGLTIARTPVTNRPGTKSAKGEKNNPNRFAGHRNRSNIPGNTTPGKKTPGKNISPGKSTPGKSTPGKSAPGKSTPGRTKAGKVTPGRTAPGKTSPGKSTPGQTTPRTTTNGKSSSGKASSGKSAFPARRPSTTPGASRGKSSSSRTIPNTGQPRKGGTSVTKPGGNSSSSSRSILAPRTTQNPSGSSRSKGSSASPRTLPKSSQPRSFASPNRTTNSSPGSRNTKTTKNPGTTKSVFGGSRTPSSRGNLSSGISRKTQVSPSSASRTTNNRGIGRTPTTTPKSTRSTNSKSFSSPSRSSSIGRSNSENRSRSVTPRPTRSTPSSSRMSRSASRSNPTRIQNSRSSTSRPRSTPAGGGRGGGKPRRK